MRQVIAALLLAALASSCSAVHRVDVYPTGVPKGVACLDGLPVKVIQSERCTDGICGYTCAPGRWRGDGCGVSYKRPE